MAKKGYVYSLGKKRGFPNYAERGTTAGREEHHLEASQRLPEGRGGKAEAMVVAVAVAVAVDVAVSVAEMVAAVMK